MKKLIIIMFFLVSLIYVNAQTLNFSDETLPKTFESVLLNVGGKFIDFTLQDTNFLEVSNRYNSIFNLFVPANNRLICGFLTKDDVQKISEGKDPEMETYILVEVSKDAENVDCKPRDFKEVISSFRDASSKILASTNEIQNEVNERLKSVDLQEIKLNEPVDLGVIFSKKDAISSGMIFKVQQGEIITTYIASILLIRLKERLLFVYIYKAYKDKTTLKEIVSITDKYATALLTANPAGQQDFISNIWDGLPDWSRNALIGGGFGLLLVFFSSLFKRKKPSEENTSQESKETHTENDNTN